MEAILLVTRYLFASLMVALVGHQIWTKRSELHFVLSVWKRFRPLMLLEVVIVIVLTLTSVITMISLFPFLKWGWLAPFLNSDTGGNILIAPIMGASDSSFIFVRIIPFIFLVALLFFLPFMAKREEDGFRRGYNTYKEIIYKSIQFGLMHLIVGIPIAAGFALIGGGLFFGYKYKKTLDRLSPKMDYKEAEDEAIMVATTYHTLSNSVITLIGVYYVLSMI